MCSSFRAYNESNVLLKKLTRHFIAAGADIGIWEREAKEPSRACNCDLLVQAKEVIMT